MSGDIYIARGDITQLAADVVVFSTSRFQQRGGELAPAFERAFPGFRAWMESLQGPGAPSEAGTHWKPLEPGSRPQAILTVPATGTDRERARRAAVRAAILQTHVRLGEPKPSARPWLLALPAFRFGWGGDRRYRLDSARAQLEAAREALGEVTGLDVVFVIYHQDDYQIFLQARAEAREKVPEAWRVVERPKLPDELVRSIRRGECVFFVGSGLSRGSGLHGWDALVARLAGELGLPVESPRSDLDFFLDVAQWYVEQHSTADLGRIVGELYDEAAESARPTLAHYLLMSLPLCHVVTTNYDRLLERTLTALRRYPTTVVHASDIAGTGARDGAYVVKFHGDARDPASLTLTRDQYDQFFRDHPAMALLLEGLLLNQTFFFVGYSLRDPDFRQIRARIGAMLADAQRPAFAITFEPVSEPLRRQWARKQVHLLEIPGETAVEKERGLDRLLEALAEAAAGGRSLPLARDAQLQEPAPGSPQSALRERLREAGDELRRVIHGWSAAVPPDRHEVREVAATLAFLTEQGWSPEARDDVPGPVSLAKLWLELARWQSDHHARREAYIRALAHARDANAAAQALEWLNADAQGQPLPAPSTASRPRRQRRRREET